MPIYTYNNNNNKLYETKQQQNMKYQISLSKLIYFFIFKANRSLFCLLCMCFYLYLIDNVYNNRRNKAGALSLLFFFITLQKKLNKF